MRTLLRIFMAFLVAAPQAGWAAEGPFNASVTAAALSNQPYHLMNQRMDGAPSDFAYTQWQEQFQLGKIHDRILDILAHETKRTLQEQPYVYWIRNLIGVMVLARQGFEDKARESLSEIFPSILIGLSALKKEKTFSQEEIADALQDLVSTTLSECITGLDLKKSYERDRIYSIIRATLEDVEAGKAQKTAIEKLTKNFDAEFMEDSTTLDILSAVGITVGAAAVLNVFVTFPAFINFLPSFEGDIPVYLGTSIIASIAATVFGAAWSVGKSFKFKAWRALRFKDTSAVRAACESKLSPSGELLP